MSEHLYSVPSWVISGVLLMSMAVAKEFGYRGGLRRGWVGEKQAKEHIHAIQNSILGILALLLVFIILDLDRPRRGLIEVNQQGLEELRAAIRE